MLLLHWPDKGAGAVGVDRWRLSLATQLLASLAQVSLANGVAGAAAGDLGYNVSLLTN